MDTGLDCRGDLPAFMKECEEIRVWPDFQERFKDFFSPAHSVEPVMNDCDFHPTGRI